MTGLVRVLSTVGRVAPPSFVDRSRHASSSKPDRREQPLRILPPFLFVPGEKMIAHVSVESTFDAIEWTARFGLQRKCTESDGGNECKPRKSGLARLLIASKFAPNSYKTRRPPTCCESHVHSKLLSSSKPRHESLRGIFNPGRLDASYVGWSTIGGWDNLTKRSTGCHGHVSTLHLPLSQRHRIYVI